MKKRERERGTDRDEAEVAKVEVKSSWKKEFILTH